MRATLIHIQSKPGGKSNEKCRPRQVFYIDGGVLNFFETGLLKIDLLMTFEVFTKTIRILHKLTMRDRDLPPEGSYFGVGGYGTCPVSDSKL